jgi:pimeloyl-ACP methyl ester carboxylesterase
MWIGGASAMPCAVRRHLLGRTQDERALLAAAKDKLPFLVIHGDADKYIQWENLEKFMRAGAFGRSRFVRMEGVGHAPFFERPREVNTAILEFVQKVVGEGA